MATLTRSLDHYYWDGNVSISVQATLYRVYRYTLVQTSQLFRDMFDPETGLLSTEGNDDANPIAIEGVEARDFDLLLNVLYLNHDGTDSTWNLDDLGRLLKMAAFCICPSAVNTGLRLLSQFRMTDPARRLHIALMNDVPAVRCNVFLHDLLTKPIATIPPGHFWLLGRDFLTVLLKQRSSVQVARYRASVPPGFRPDSGCEHKSLCKRIWIKLWKCHLEQALLEDEIPLKMVVERLERVATSQVRDCECIATCMNNHGQAKLASEQAAIRFGMETLIEYFAV